MNNMEDKVHWREFTCPECGTLDEVQYDKRTRTFCCVACRVRYKVGHDVSKLTCAHCDKPLIINKYGHIEYDDSFMAPWRLDCYEEEMSPENCKREYEAYCNGEDEI